jgi:dTDP-4-amino-4,6-dideoxygalactose transaminase
VKSVSKLAIHGGRPVRTAPFPTYRTIGEEEKRAVIEVLDSGVLSGFVGNWTPEFYGGPRVRKLEREWAEYFGVKHAVTVNSATSGLNAAVGASGVGPGDEVIVSPYTMSASAACALVYNAIPVFADIDPETFCISAETIRQCLTPRTKAIVIVDIFGHPFARQEVMALAREHKLIVIEDAAQAPGALYEGQYAGTLGHMGVFSLNYHKTIHTGEGGVIVTDDDSFAERLQLIRNHAEVVVGEKGMTNLVNMLGFNYRMGEMEAAIGSEQLKKLDRLLKARIEAADYLTERLRQMPGLTPPRVAEGVRHGYYVYAIRYDARKAGVPRDKFVKALNAEGIPMTAGYVEPLYLQPLYQQRTVYGRQGCPFTCSSYTGSARYDKGICPVTERMYYDELMLTNICHADIGRRDLEDALTAMQKVLEHAREL